ncbi:hypothetical protein SAMN05216353_10282 [Halobacillus alkaliphilus]|uniref:Uncharacterized protein n=1 Tax=Halobacillus alkaliphilus TaxID=396056 RepID=A0A1I2JXI7_9BACI|nr:hypothetical protein SAMN05216353_10282 [Halobacillus alkaliphilus]
MLLPGDPSIPWSTFAKKVDRKVVIIQDNNNRKSVGFTTENVTEEVYESEKILKRTQILKSDLLDIEAISMISKDTFKPYKHKISTNSTTKTVEYLGSYIQLIKGDSEKKIKIENDLFENHSVEMVIRLLPLQHGYSTHLFVFHAGKEKIIKVSISVVAKEFVKKNGPNMVESWKTEVNFEGTIQIYWISIKEKELLKQENVLSGNEKLIFERE